MMEQINGWLILTACFFLVFLVITFLAARYRTQIQSFFTKHPWLSTKIPWNTITKIFCLWVGIHLLKKVVYFVSFHGVIQTKFSILWVDKKTTGFLYLIIILFMFIIFLLVLRLVRVIKKLFTKPLEMKSGESSLSSELNESKPIFSTNLLDELEPIFFIVFYVGWIITLMCILFAIGSMSFVQIIFTPLLLLKMLCSGKYLGLFTSLAAAYLILETSKKLKPKITRNNAKYLIAPVVILLGFLIFSSYHFPGDWEKKFQHKLQAAKSEKAFGDLLDASHSIKDNLDKSNTLRIIALAIAESGDTPLAKSVANSIPNEKIKNRALKHIREKTGEQ